ncbi:MAG: hypothetical protein KGH61_04805 [Candidatus Micrarchaeota archaeon]|nr:hypothetical protein [Candidatus Micrarchaeota archaeon]MDE1848237.1 hypothetical protein [Candidatus Micrarchaeota archaeon]MDE1864909.1 hypothetical protein [Candidatus Micrarchaeota archaeon]
MIIQKPGNELSKEIYELYHNNKLRAAESKNAPSIKSAARKLWNQTIAPYTNDSNSFPALMEKLHKDSVHDMISELKFGKIVPLLDLENLRERGVNFGLPHYNFFTLQFGSTSVRGGQLIQKEKPNGIVVTGFFPPESDLFNRKYLTAYSPT